LGVSERVTLTGQVSEAELDAMYRGARAFAMPSLSEGFGLPVLEAMTRGIPVVCSNSGSLPEITGDAALLHNPLDDVTLARHLVALWCDDAVRDDYARRAVARAAQFSWQQAAAETLDVYRAALQNRKSQI
jgi:alpha-1,3-rhamnosyl/mannosyltransferase